MPPTSKILDVWFKIFGFLVSTHFRHFWVKTVVFGVRDHHEWIQIEIWSHIQVSMLQIEFSEAISKQITCFSTIFSDFHRLFGMDLGWIWNGSGMDLGSGCSPISDPTQIRFPPDRKLAIRPVRQRAVTPSGHIRDPFLNLY